MRQLYRIEAPRLIGWAAHVDDIDALSRQLTAAGIAFDPPRDGSRQRPSGQTLRWRALALRNDAEGLLPFFIEWSKDSVHPAVDAPAGCRIDRFELATPRGDELRAVTARLRLEVTVASAPSADLRATLSGPKGQLSLPA